MSAQVALVTGASKGLGAEIVRVLARDGFDVAFTYRSDADAAKSVRAEVEGHGRRALAVRMDAADHGGARRVVDETVASLGGLGALVCNAGYNRAKAILKMDEADWDDVVSVSLKSAFNYIRAVAPVFTEQRSGRIVCIGSINGLRGRIGSAAYNTAKAGLVGLVKTAAAELGPSNVNVNLVAPGYIETPSQEATSELIRDLVVKETALKRLGTPADIAGVVAFLVSDAARHVTGQVIKVDGGQYL